jgi:hypothetical protein
MAYRSEKELPIGVITFSVLKNETWWKEKDISLILTEDPIIEDIETRNLKKSLEPAGIL